MNTLLSIVKTVNIIPFVFADFAFRRERAASRNAVIIQRKRPFENRRPACDRAKNAVFSQKRAFVRRSRLAVALRRRKIAGL